jgi:hypothetical protein
VNARSERISSNYLYYSVAALVIFLAMPVAHAQPREPWLSTKSTTSSLNGVAFGNGQFVAVGASGVILTSTDGANWVLRAGATNQVVLHAVTYGSNGFVAVGEATSSGNSQPAVWVSPDGTSWTSEDVSFANMTFGHWLLGVTYGGGLYVAVGGNYTTNTVWTSPNGAAWTMRDSHLSNSGLNPISSVAYGNGMYVAAGAWLITSPDGVTWTQQNSSAWYRLYAMTFSNGRFVGVGPYSRITSTNGINWTVGGPPTADYIYGVTYGDGYYVCLGYKPAYTIEGTNWISQTNSFSGNAIAFGNSVFVAVDSSGNIFRTASAMHANVQRDSTARLTLTALVPGTCRIECSSNPASGNWNTLTNIPLTASPTNWTDWSSTNASSRFYRAVWSP